jgi:hypothetical protein
MTYPELTELDRRICHTFYESCKTHPKDPNLTEEEKEMLNDSECLKRLAKKYFNAELIDYEYRTTE